MFAHSPKSATFFVPVETGLQDRQGRGELAPAEPGRDAGAKFLP
jgi:hypothetical protein